MRNAGIPELKKELAHLSQKELIELCVLQARRNKESRDYLSFLLFDAHNKQDFANDVKTLIDENFKEIKLQSNLYYVKKSLRKVLRIIVRYCNYMKDDALAAELHIYFCVSLKQSGINYEKSQLIVNIMEQQMKRIDSLISKLHDDLQSDFARDLEKLR